MVTEEDPVTPMLTHQIHNYIWNNSLWINWGNCNWVTPTPWTKEKTTHFEVGRRGWDTISPSTPPLGSWYTNWEGLADKDQLLPEDQRVKESASCAATFKIYTWEMCPQTSSFKSYQDLHSQDPQAPLALVASGARVHGFNKPVANKETVLNWLSFHSLGKKEQTETPISWSFPERERDLHTSKLLP